MKQKHPLVPTKEDEIMQLIWQELRMLNIGLTNIELKVDDTNHKLNEINHRLLSVYDFNHGISQIRDLLSAINDNLKR